MKENSVKRAVINTSAIFLLIIGIMVFLYLKDPSRNYLYYQTEDYLDVVVASSDLLPGEVIDTSNVNLVSVENSILLDNEELFVKNIDEVIGKKLLYPLKNGQVVQSSYLIEKEDWYEGKHEYTIEVNVPNTVANSIGIGDYVDVNVSYNQNMNVEELYNGPMYENFDIVIPKVMVEDIRDEKGMSIKQYDKNTVDETFSLRYIKLNITYEQIDEYLGAERMGSVFLIKYGDITAPANEKTFNIESKKNKYVFENGKMIDTNKEGNIEEVEEIEETEEIEGGE